MLEYTLCIADPISGMQWDISYSEYFPVTGAPDCERKGNTWIGSDKDGLLSLWKSGAGIMWRKKFKSPITGVFEVFVGHTTGKTTLARQLKLTGMELFLPRAYVGIYQDQLYVLSEQNYPMLGKAGLEVVNHLGIEGSEDNNEGDDCRPGSDFYPSCLVGPHAIGYSILSDTVLTMNDGYDQQDERGSIPKPITLSGAHEPFALPPPVSMTTTLIGWLVIAIGVLAGLVYSRGVEQLTRPVDAFLEDQNVQFRIGGLVKVVTVGGVVSAFKSAGSALGISGRNRKDTLPAFNGDIVSLPIHSESEQTANGVPNGSSANETEWNEKSGVGSRTGPRSKAPGQEADDGKANGANGAGGNGSGGGGGRKKKRGGGGKGQKGPAANAAANAATAGTGDTASGEDGTKSSPGQKDSSSTGSKTASSSDNSIKSGETADAASQETVSLRPQSNAPLLKSIQVTDNILGYGSHGTVVYKGTYDGRSVAVKRLLIDFYDVAFHEVRLLQESDDHPNVVRYFRSVSDLLLLLLSQMMISTFMSATSLT